MTAVEWLTEQYLEQYDLLDSDLYLKAKEMEKQERHSEYMRGWKDGYSKQELKPE